MDADLIKSKTFLFAIAAVCLLEALHLFLSSQWQSVSPLAIIGIIRVLEIITLMVLIRFQPLSLNVTPLRIKRSVQNGLIWSFIIGSLSVLIFALLLLVGFNPLKFIQETAFGSHDHLLLYLLVGCFIGPIAEEMFFRGVLFRFIRRWGFFNAMIFSTFWFSLLHLGGHSVPILPIIGGFLFALIYEFEKSLLPVIIVHSLGNGMLFFIQLFW